MQQLFIDHEAIKNDDLTVELSENTTIGVEIRGAHMKKLEQFMKNSVSTVLDTSKEKSKSFSASLNKKQISKIQIVQPDDIKFEPENPVEITGDTTVTKKQNSIHTNQDDIGEMEVFKSPIMDNSPTMDKSPTDGNSSNLDKSPMLESNDKNKSNMTIITKVDILYFNFKTPQLSAKTKTLEQEDGQNQNTKENISKQKKLRKFFEILPIQVEEHSKDKYNKFQQKINQKIVNKFEIVNIEKQIKEKSKDLKKLRKQISEQKVEQNQQDIAQKPPLPKLKMLGMSPEPQQKGIYNYKITKYYVAQDLIRRMNSQRRELQYNKQIKEQKKIQEFATKESETAEQRVLNEKRILDEKRQLINQRMFQEQQLRQEQTRSNLEGNKVIKQIKHHRQNEENGVKKLEEDLMRPELERRKAELARKREMSQPVRIEQLKEHQKKYEEEKKLQVAEREKQKNEHQSQLKAYILKHPKSKVQILMEEQERVEKEKQVQAEEFKKHMREKEMQYNQVIKETVVVNRRRINSTNEALFKGIDHKQQSPLKGGQVTDYLKMMREKDSDRKNSKKTNKSANQSENGYNILQQQDASFISQTIPQSEENLRKYTPKRVKQVVQEIEKTEPIRIDYLKQQRQIRKKTGEADRDEDWQKYVDDSSLPKIVKYQNVLQSIHKIEEKAKRKEQIKNADAEEEADRLYVDSIKAKLALLQQK